MSILRFLLNIQWNLGYNTIAGINFTNSFERVYQLIHSWHGNHCIPEGDPKTMGEFDWVYLCIITIAILGLVGHRNLPCVKQCLNAPAVSSENKYYGIPNYIRYKMQQVIDTGVHHMFI